MVMVNGELGLKEISEYIENRMLNFWYNVATGDENKISTILYKWINILYFQDKYKSAWFDKINLSLSTINMSDCFYNTASLSKAWFKNTVKVKLNEVYAQRWAESVFNNSACINYRAMTIVKKMQNYILKLPKPYIYALCKFKCANHYMPIVAGRFANIPIDERKCTLCERNEIGDEFHYLLKCNFFNSQRIKYIKNYYYTKPNMIKMQQMFESSDIQEMTNLAKFTVIILAKFKNN